jgi:four helix bundle suffix protein
MSCWAACTHTYATYASHSEKGSPEKAANTIICLIHWTNYLPDQQLRSQDAALLKEGGLRERMTRARLETRKKTR